MPGVRLLAGGEDDMGPGAANRTTLLAVPPGHPCQHAHPQSEAERACGGHISPALSASNTKLTAALIGTTPFPNVRSWSSR